MNSPLGFNVYRVSLGTRLELESGSETKQGFGPGPGWAS